MRVDGMDTLRFGLLVSIYSSILKGILLVIFLWGATRGLMPFHKLSFFFCFSEGELWILAI